ASIKGSHGRGASIDLDLGGGAVAAFIGGKVERRPGHVVDFAQALHRNATGELAQRLLLAQLLEERLDDAGAYEGGMDRVAAHVDPLARAVDRDRLAQRGHRGLGGVVDAVVRVALKAASEEMLMIAAG